MALEVEGSKNGGSLNLDVHYATGYPKPEDTFEPLCSSLDASLDQNLRFWRAWLIIFTEYKKSLESIQ